MAQKIEPSLESITVRGKYEIPETDFDVVFDKAIKELQHWGWGELPKIGESIALIYSGRKKMAKAKDWIKYLKSIRSGIPVYFSITAVEHHKESIS